MAKKRPVGTCKLCEERKLLCDSHYLPKRLYEILNAPELKNPNPVMSINGALRQRLDRNSGLAQQSAKRFQLWAGRE